MTVLPYLSAIRFSGADAGDFLHNQVSADVLALSSGDSTFACYCEPKGRVLALMLIARVDDDYYVLMSRSLTSSVASRIKIYVMRAQVNIDVLDDSEVAGLHPDDASQDPIDRLCLVKVPDSGNTLLISDGNTPLQTRPAEADAWKLAELKRGITWLNSESSGQFLPQMLDFDSLGAVNFRKGCYPGQEIVARTHYLGKVKRHPRLLCTTAKIVPKPLEKIRIYSAGDPFDAIIADCGRREDNGNCLLVVTRLNPEARIEQMEYQGQMAPLI